LLADLGGRLGLRWPDFADETQAALAEVLPKHGQANNPTDVTSAAIGARGTYPKCIEVIGADRNIDAVVPVLTMAAQSDVEQVSDAIRNLNKAGAILWTGGCNDNPELTPKTLIEQGVPVYRDAQNCLRAFRACADYSEFQRRIRQPQAFTPLSARDLAEVRSMLAQHAGVVGEHDAKLILAQCGFRSPKEALARDADDAVRITLSIAGPVALKISSGQIMHKTEAGGVKLDVTGEKAVRSSFAQIIAAAKSYDPSAVLDGVLVQEMAPSDGVDVIIGIAPDRTFGRVVMVGLGGIHVEVLKDVAFGIPPFSTAEAMTMLRQLRGFPLLEGVRGQAPCDIDALCQAISKLSQLADNFGDEIAELDINPLRVYPKGRAVQVLDAVITLVEGRQQSRCAEKIAAHDGAAV